MEKVVLFAFRGDPLCFIHVLLNGLDLKQRGQQGLIILEGEAVKLVEPMSEPGHFLHPLYKKAREANLIHGACKACATKLDTIDAINKEEIPLIGDMANHPSMGAFIEKGYKVITF